LAFRSSDYITIFFGSLRNYFLPESLPSEESESVAELSLAWALVLTIGGCKPLGRWLIRTLEPSKEARIFTYNLLAVLQFPSITRTMV
ncbi:hypothetical protein, partial [Microcoleus sp. K5-D4]|uniref:hypothetical protein n=1 Tax=Microcoleus sp. K5-D4 TaxID=2818801 RepID=UPI002FD76235